ncbi:DeoR/GlpR family DNA-binding transcription regulator [Pseudonocardia eucalypti]|uniref:DeoR/GlpR family DNA-binding transcription regulator n=1 Tax=Pseudonocardia eucalypti TaxID=648755 RepID=A0ABP9RBT1_9PSEU|nr:DeoR/GlpR family transcriptional regulator of sugar metabolism [Pseudonocardia eucalypti]
MRPRDRRDLIYAELLAGRGTVAELCALLGVSAATVRRDLRLLTDQGRATRTYGGAVTGPLPLERTLGQKERRAEAEKDAIARCAAAEVRDGEVLILDAGTTTGRLAHHLAERDGLTVLTNGINTLVTLSHRPSITLITLGGQLRHTSQALVGPLAEETLRHVVADRVFLGADGVLAERGLSCPTLEQASLKALMASRARAVYVLADHTKLGAAPFPFFAPLTTPATLITDAGAPASAVAALDQDPHLRVRLASGVARP